MTRKPLPQEAAALADAGLPDLEAQATASPTPTTPPETTAALAGAQAPIATDYVKAVHPDTGLEVVFVPGERLPAWAVASRSADG